MKPQLEEGYTVLLNKAIKCLEHREKTRALGITPFEVELLEKMRQLEFLRFRELVDLVE